MEGLKKEIERIRKEFVEAIYQRTIGPEFQKKNDIETLIACSAAMLDDLNSRFRAIEEARNGAYDALNEWKDHLDRLVRTMDAEAQNGDV